MDLLTAFGCSYGPYHPFTMKYKGNTLLVAKILKITLFGVLLLLVVVAAKDLVACITLQLQC